MGDHFRDNVSLAYPVSVVLALDGPAPLYKLRLQRQRREQSLAKQVHVHM
jgi:hypothetical protein